MTAENHLKVRQFLATDGERLRLEPMFVRFVTSVETRPACFGYRCEAAENGWTVWLPEVVEIAYALWSCCADQTLLVCEPGRIYFGAAHHDEPTLRYIASTAQGLMAELFLTLWEDEVSDIELAEAAALCGYLHLEQGIQVSTEHGRAKQRNAIKRDFIDSVDRRATAS